jgi:hypothetical protein
MADTSNKVDEDVEKETKQPQPDAIFVIAATDHQQPSDKAASKVLEAAADSEADQKFV